MTEKVNYYTLDWNTNLTVVSKQWKDITGIKENVKEKRKKWNQILQNKLFLNRMYNRMLLLCDYCLLTSNSLWKWTVWGCWSTWPTCPSEWWTRCWTCLKLQSSSATHQPTACATTGGTFPMMSSSKWSVSVLQTLACRQGWRCALLSLTSIINIVSMFLKFSDLKVEKNSSTATLFCAIRWCSYVI